MNHLALIVVLLLALCSFAVIGCRQPSGALPGADALTSVPQLDLDRYLGTWYEIARYPNSFEKDLVAVTARYERRDDGDIRVINAGHKNTPDGPRKEATARAWVPDPEEPARLKVRFFWPFSGNYWVIALDEEYQWAVVGEPSRRYLWILARSPELPEDVKADIIRRIEQLGYDPGRLEYIPH